MKFSAPRNIDIYSALHVAKKELHRTKLGWQDIRTATHHDTTSNTSLKSVRFHSSYMQVSAGVRTVVQKYRYAKRW